MRNSVLVDGAVAMRRSLRQNALGSADYGSRPGADIATTFLMTVEGTSIVDAVGTDKETGEARLSIFDHLPWDAEQEHLRLLQDKINVYLGFIESGEIYVSYPNAKGRSLVIDVFTKFRPTEDAARFLKQAAAVAASYGASLRRAPSTGGYVDDSA